jgi:hypothetical protein
VFFVEKNGRNVLYGHFDMDPLYDTDEAGIRFVTAGSYGPMALAEQTLETPWCDRLATAAER